MSQQTAVARRRGRPAREHEGYGDTREALVRAGVVALTTKGFSSTGLDEILRGVGVPKGSFYHYFGSKEAFGAELIDRYAEYFARRLDDFLLDEQEPPLQRLRNFTSDAESAMARHGFERGCLVGNLGQESGALPESYRTRLRQVFDDWQQRTARCLEAARASGELASAADCQRLAAYFWIGWEGAVLRAKLERDAAPLRLFADMFFAGLPR
ncbi:acrylate utilization transcriptional regulator AcuR [Azohydromonas caseinilytica]|uniref:TetR family transcriptional regulator n=1 Tax=Azohydromonas caseinilytica TaxID=2728836 RepID=A0A848FIQ8_9BURK|nr:TetR/AcrR family transcriptional regulator [Azohydromonas caseinilytica]NML18123.1 TetR family transcriptional regulator [Azohydromonas caseinilytica]